MTFLAAKTMLILCGNMYENLDSIIQTYIVGLRMRTSNNRGPVRNTRQRLILNLVFYH